MAGGALGGVLRVLATRREEGLRELALDVEDASGSLQEELYSRGEVSALFAQLRQQLERTARRELEHCAHSAGVAVRLLAEEVRRPLGAELELADLQHRLEEPGLLQEVRALEERALALPAGDFAALGSPAGPRGGGGGGTTRNWARSGRRSGGSRRSCSLRARTWPGPRPWPRP